MGKLAIFAIIIVAVWFLFFRRKMPRERDSTRDEIAHDMIECDKCGSFFAKNEGVFANGRWFCSKECLIGKDS